VKKFKSALFLIVLSLFFILFAYQEGFMCLSNDYAAARREMVTGQIKERGVSDKSVLDAMLKVERHKFVPAVMRHLSYTDHPLPIGSGQTISQPYIVALMTELIISSNISGETQLKAAGPAVPEKLKILEIGTGSGYQAAILGELSYEVYTIEIIESLGKQAATLLKELGYKNIFVKIGDGYKGWPEKAPFDRIIVTCAPEDAPQALLEQLNPDGGRMIIPVGEAGSTQQLVLIKRNGDKYIRDFITYVMFVPMVGGKD
jgi:protein-L-isoaspartate(D-aspartate) O-methyltransferase